MTTRQILPNRRPSITQKIKIGTRRTVSLSTDSAGQPLEVFMRCRHENAVDITLEHIHHEASHETAAAAHREGMATDGLGP